MQIDAYLYRKRRIKNGIALIFGSAAAVLGLSFLAWILGTTLLKGMTALSPSIFVEMTPPPGATGGGLANALFGSVLITLLGTAIGAPIGILAGLWLAEYARHSKLGLVVRFVNDILLSAPSIVIGLFIYTVVVMQLSQLTGGSVGFSGLAGSLALAMLVVPVVTRTTDEMMQLQPSAMREAALALGIPQWKVTLQILLRASRAGVVTGVLLAIARITGETAPLLFTAFGNQYWNADLLQPMATVPVTIFQFAMSPFENWQQLAWAGALLLTLFVLFLNLSSRFYFRNRDSK
ncbi:phosphate ABC transporter permease [Pseudomonas oryzihabitans]|uniref:phosphate ABC transporter permease PstA n=1 Tax=Pseudomonas rhizoryzae TaxID=2571129 RepID=UPI0007370C20|nr:phosphate ABC transporter permease PstA [Pseudomonas rhizoryzae]APQ11819.1 phosphate ABC transporter, permease protein PstA [Pseudomonas psychrotolerans]KTS75244.1 phosphate ABC transporter permease [Pseudomonas psychrotolerans]KTT04186.1 phosphate ABC transporter permease [Pseudomonas psychrotolerans]KTT08950.1 phosphate ABC transporter permease [Pseudomonas psychrotolerans]KTT21155.1 phosphate ABC transporter permease [Pseudomonas psychrotolerans]